MAEQSSQPNYVSPRQTPNRDKYAYLRAEAKAPYRPLRQFVYIACGASGFIGALIFLTQILAGREVGAALPNFALQVGIVALMIVLFRLEGQTNRKRNRVDTH
jgi:Low psii accumulation1 / Rep27